MTLVFVLGITEASDINIRKNIVQESQFESLNNSK